MQLSSAKRFKYTKMLVLISILGSLATAVTAPFGWGELYPFATWKLYTQPLGSKNHIEEYRIYTLAPGDTIWQRQAVVKTSENLSPDEYTYTLNSLVNHTLSGKPDSAAFYVRLKSFVKYVAPKAAAYKIVRETYQPLQYLQNPQQYDTLTVIRF